MPDHHLAGEIAAIVLVGGASSRMGADKASLVVDGEAMADRVVRVLEQCGITEVVVAGTDAVPDAVPGRSGPLAGVVGGWRALRSRGSAAEVVAVLACDLPSLSATVVQALVEHCGHVSHGVVAHDGERPQPLIAAYRSNALDAMERAFEAGERSIRRCSHDWDLPEISFDSTVLADADRPEDLEGFTVQWP